MTERDRLPNRRAAETFEITARGRRYTATIGHYADGRLAEVFLTGGKTGSDAEINVRDAAVLLSLALQHGCPAEALRSSLMRDELGRAEGPVGVLLDMLTDGGAHG